MSAPTDKKSRVFDTLQLIDQSLASLSQKERREVLTMVSAKYGLRIISVNAPIYDSVISKGKKKPPPQPVAAWKRCEEGQKLLKEQSDLQTQLRAIPRGSNPAEEERLVSLLRTCNNNITVLKEKYRTSQSSGIPPK